MNKINYLYILIFLLLSSCQQEDIINKGVGFVQFAVEKNTSTIPMTKATDLPIALQVIDNSGKVIKETDDWNKWAATPVELPLGTYTVKAFSKDINSSTARFDEPYYVGQAEVTVTAKVNQSVNIECKLADVKVTVFYSADVKKYFSALNCKIKNTSGELIFGKEENRSGYFIAQDLNVALALTNTDGKSFLFESEPIINVASRQHYRINYSMKASGSVGDVSITLDPSTKEYNVNILIPKEGAPIASTWATFADVSLSTSETSTDIACKYRVSKTEEWNIISGNQVSLENGKLITKITGLTPDTQYDFCFTIDGKDGKIATATTEAAIPLPNSNFDNWYTNSKAVYMGDTSEEKNAFWDSGNVGAATMGKNPTNAESSDIHTEGGKAAKMTSQYVGALGIGKFAAGNLYTGHYCQTYKGLSADKLGARIRFGRSFTSRPTQLKGWYKYTRATSIGFSTNDTYKSELESSGGDKCAIYIVLTDNVGMGDGTAYEVDNKGISEDKPNEYKYVYSVDFSDKNKDVIAYGSISEEEAKGISNWTEFTIDLKYRDLTRKPKYIIVVASASKYGDFFTGGEGSTLLIDDFELVYGIPVTTAN